ncbi:MAG: SMP-30/gluconolactonase/LRE family protein [Cytophagales bacterium]|nr:SMP-30/gluconolactonase/LRE family protein [Cytophagales bacterium]
MKILKIVLACLTLIIGFVIYTIQSTGFFRTIENRFDGNYLKSIDIVGAEDMQIDYEEGFVLISSDDRADRRDGNPGRGAIYKMDLNDLVLEPQRLPSTYRGKFNPHGIYMKKLSDSVHRLWVVNHVRSVHSIEVFDLRNDSLMHLRSHRDATMISPNDVVALDADRFYYTNDHGNVKGFSRILEDYGGLRASNVGYFDGKEFRQVADGIAYANGINYDSDRNLLFVASPRGFLVKVYNVLSSGDLDHIEDIDCSTGVDNIAFDEQGKIWIGAHPSLLDYSSYSQAKREIAPSEIITIDYRGESDYAVESIYLEEGAKMSGATVAVPYNNLIFVGNVMDDHFLVLQRD